MSLTHPCSPGSLAQEWQWNEGCHWSAAGLVFGARSTSEFLTVELPISGMQYKSESTWATVNEHSAGQWRRSLAFEMLSGVSSSPGVWHTTTVTLSGASLKVSVDGRPVRVPPLPEPPRGRLGLVTYSGMGATPKALFRNVRLSATPLPTPTAFNATPSGVVPFRVVPDADGDGILISNIVATAARGAADSSAVPPVAMWVTSTADATGERHSNPRAGPGGRLGERQATGGTKTLLRSSVCRIRLSLSSYS